MCVGRVGSTSGSWEAPFLLSSLSCHLNTVNGAVTSHPHCPGKALPEGSPVTQQRCPLIPTAGNYLCDQVARVASLLCPFPLSDSSRPGLGVPRELF